MLKIITPATAEAITAEEARVELRVDSDDFVADARLPGLIAEAVQYAEHYTGRTMLPTTVEMPLDAFPCDWVIPLEMPPVSSVTSVKYNDADGVETTLATSQYVLDTYTADRITRAYGVTWPVTRCEPNAVRVRYVAGYTTLPKAVRSALLLHIKLGYEQLDPKEREAYECARDSLLNTVKKYP